MDPLNIAEVTQPIFQLFVSLLQHFGLISAVAFLLLSSRALRRMISGDLTVQDKSALIVFFSCFGILATYSGDPIFGAIPNLRAVSVITAGLLGGPVVGFGVGLIAGGHRFLIDIGGLTALPCGLATFLEGVGAGIISSRMKQGVLNWRVAVIFGLLGESLHMGMVLAMARPFETALAVVKVIGMPMILLNSIGAGCLVEVLHRVVRDRERRASIQARKAMTIANRSVSHLREGLNKTSAQATAQIIHEQTRVAAVAITDDTRLLAYAGIGETKHPVGGVLRTKTTVKVLETGKAFFSHGLTAVGEEVPHRMLTSAIVVPLKKSGQPIGTLKFYGAKKQPLTHTDFEIAIGLADLFSTQLELEDIQIKTQLLAQAEIKRLQAQINPHFLFNSLNTIASFCRTNSDRARQLLIELANYLRRNIKDRRKFITLQDELEQIKSYLAIEHARFGERIQFEMDIDEGIKHWPLPSLIVQPLVENAVKHGLAGKEMGGTIKIQASRNNGDLRIRVNDDGIGIPASTIAEVFATNSDHLATSGLGLRNVNQRLEKIYGPSYRMQIESTPQKGTTIDLNLPMVQENAS